MAFSYETYTGNGSTSQYDFNKGYISRSHITATLDGVPALFTWVTDTRIDFGTNVANGVAIKITRTTPNSPTALTVFSNGSGLPAADLNRVLLQALYVAQEGIDGIEDSLQFDVDDDKWDAESKVMKNLADATGTGEAVTKDQLDAAVILSGNVPTPNNPADDGKFLKANAGTFAWASQVIDDLTDLPAWSNTFLKAANKQAALGTTAYSETLLDDANAGAARTTLGITGDFFDQNRRSVADVSAERYYAGGGIRIATDTAHDLRFGPGTWRDETNTVTMKRSVAAIKQLDALWVTGSGNGGFGGPAEFTAQTTVSFTNGTATIAGTGLFSGVAVGSTVFFSGSSLNDGVAFDVSAATANDITVSPAPTNESAGASITMYVVAPNTPYYAFMIDDGNNNTHIGYDSDPDATNLLALSGYTYYRQAAGFMTDGSANIRQKGGFYWVWPSNGGRVDIFTSSGTWNRQDWAQYTDGWMWGAGGSGGIWIVASAGAGGGGAFVKFENLSHSVLTAGTVSVTIGAGGAARTTNATAGLAGGATSFGSLVVAGGGAGGDVGSSNNCATVAGGVVSGAFDEFAAYKESGGAGGGVNSGTEVAGENTVWAGSSASGAYIGVNTTGTSVFGGNAGNSRDDGGSAGMDGAFPAGGGGGNGSTTLSGAGADGFAVFIQH